VPHDSDDNEPVEDYQALLITGDPTGNVGRIFKGVKDLTKEEFDRYSRAYKTLEDILVTNMFAYFLTSAKTFIANWDAECKALATSPLPLNGDPDPIITLGFRLRGAVLSVCSALCYHQERTLEEAAHKFGRERASSPKRSRRSSTSCMTTTSGTAISPGSATF
jgi:hypothetical protein